MPYRRLPNTDQARLRTLRAILGASATQQDDSVVSYKSQLDAKTLLQNFEHAISLYQQMYERQINSNKDFQEVFQNAKLYLSHFIQVLNMSIIRGEIKAEIKQLYHLPEDAYSMPNLSSADALVEAGAYIMEGEAKRIRLGGTPLYNPTIAKVNVHYDIFKEYRLNQLSLQQNTQRYAAQVNSMREAVDTLIADIWNQIETRFLSLPPYQRLETCKSWGVIYYYRRGEALLTPADDLPKPQTELQKIVVSEEIKIEIEPETAQQEHRLFDESEQQDSAPVHSKIHTLLHKKKRNRTTAQPSLLSLFFNN